MKLIVGLGNPGYEYVWTRHNAGWTIVDSFVARLGLRVGIGSPEGRMDLKDWVLGKIPQEQRREWHKIEDAAWEALVLWLSGDADRAMSKANGFRLNDGE